MTIIEREEIEKMIAKLCREDSDGLYIDLDEYNSMCISEQELAEILAERNIELRKVSKENKYKKGKIERVFEPGKAWNPHLTSNKGAIRARARHYERTAGLADEIEKQYQKDLKHYKNNPWYGESYAKELRDEREKDQQIRNERYDNCAENAKKQIEFYERMADYENIDELIDTGEEVYLFGGDEYVEDLNSLIFFKECVTKVISLIEERFDTFEKVIFYEYCGLYDGIPKSVRELARENNMSTGEIYKILNKISNNIRHSRVGINLYKSYIMPNNETHKKL